MDLLVGGWQLTGIYNYYSGQFLTPMWNGPDPTGTRFSQSRTPANVALRPDHLRDANLPSSERSLERWFDVGAFDPPDGGRFGTSAKGVIVGPHVNVWHMGVVKNFRFTETVLFHWELTATNVFNHPNWNNPLFNISNQDTVGTINNAGGVHGGATGDQPGPEYSAWGSASSGRRCARTKVASAKRVSIVILPAILKLSKQITGRNKPKIITFVNRLTNQ